jgi:hypothetical protein
MNKSLRYIIGFLLVGFLLSSCSSNIFFTGSSQTGVFYNQVALRTGGGGGGGFSPYKRKYRQGRQIEPNDVFHTVGISFMPGVNGVGGYNANGFQQKFSLGYPTMGFHYTPRFNLATWGRYQGSFALELPIHFGVSIGRDFVGNYPNIIVANRMVKESTNFTAEIPLVFTLNFGHNATKKSYQDFGGFVGLGYSFAYLPSGRTGVYNPPSPTESVAYNLPIGHGPHLRGGFRFRTGTLSWQVYGSFMYNIYAPSHIGGVGIGLTMGRW